jgi:hypothetical protein
MVVRDTEKPDYKTYSRMLLEIYQTLRGLGITISTLRVLISACDTVNAGWLSATYFFISPRPSFSKFLATGDATQNSHHNNLL